MYLFICHKLATYFYTLKLITIIITTDNKNNSMRYIFECTGV